jgi:hypothetical protein
METTIRRMPIGLLDHIQTVCARQDQQFITDVARILGLSGPAAHEMRRKIIGTLGTPTLVCTEPNPWWVDTQCPIMIKSRCGMWTRCGSTCESTGTCWQHRVTKKPLHTDPAFAQMESRTPFRYDGDLYWVSEKDGSALDSTGTRQMDFTVNLKSRLVMYTKKTTPTNGVKSLAEPDAEPKHKNEFEEEKDECCQSKESQDSQDSQDSQGSQDSQDSDVSTDL